VAVHRDNDARWRIGAGESISLRCWDGDFVVYNPLSGNTHVLDIVTGEILRAIMARTMSESELCTHVASFLEVPNDAGVAEHVGRIVATLDRLALIEPANGC
jgi:PqqD family protein of HPr-rel-A system